MHSRTPKVKSNYYKKKTKGFKLSFAWSQIGAKRHKRSYYRKENGEFYSVGFAIRSQIFG